MPREPMVVHPLERTEHPERWLVRKEWWVQLPRPVHLLETMKQREPMVIHPLEQMGRLEHLLEQLARKEPKVQKSQSEHFQEPLARRVPMAIQQRTEHVSVRKVPMAIRPLARTGQPENSLGPLAWKELEL
jgi:hypothetical protein